MFLRRCSLAHIRRAFPGDLLRELLGALLLMPLLASAAPADDAAASAALEAAAQAWTQAYNARDTDALVALTTPDVVLMDATLAPVSGREAVRSSLAHALGAAQGRMTSVTKEAVVVGDVAWRISAIAHTVPNANGISRGESLDRGQSLEIWKRVNGRWRMHRQMSSTVLAQPRLFQRPLPSEPVLDAPR